MNHDALNDLIHLLKKYRNPANKWEGKCAHFYLVLGVQSSNTDELFVRITIQNFSKLTVKNFHFPSMKNNIVQVVNHMLLSMDSSTLSFGHSVIANLVEQINMYGISVAKFRRMIKVMLADFAFETDS